MKPAEYNSLPGIDRMRMAVKAFGDCNESFLQRFSPHELMILHAMWVASEWDFRPDTWTRGQVTRALKGHPPCWDSNENPVYA